MIPSILAEQLQQGTKDFLRATFPTSSPFFQGMLERLLAEEHTALFRGPYISIQLPFRQGSGKRDFFADVPMRFPPYLHQEEAFQRLQTGAYRSTIVATGTGSGKSECFLFPILAHCLRHKGEKGIKALLIYPMNALATDQSRRIARMIHTNAALKQAGVTAGLYIGEQAGSQGNASMSAEQVITSRDIMKEEPPDILLTNYKMLDYLLLRPEDQRLWRHNTAETLRYLVVDELHTFDGAQGTDLACLIRRLKDRLQVPQEQLCCVGTSATIGDSDAGQELREYASSIFGEEFEEGCVIRESRLTAGEYLADSLLTHLRIHEHRPRDLDPNQFEDREAYIRRQYELWFGKDAPSELDESWRVSLGGMLKSHVFFQNLVRVMRGEICELSTLVHEMARVSQLPGVTRDDLPRLIDSICALISFARSRVEGADEGGTAPFLHVRVQLWLRELARMVATVSEDPNLHFSDDRGAEGALECLPILHCRDCGAMGWGGVHIRGEDLLRKDLRDFYQRFFKQSPGLTFAFPSSPDEPVDKSFKESKRLCSRCLYLNPEDAVQCHGCQGEQLIYVRLYRELQQNARKAHNYISKDCPYCEASNGLTILGSRAASLTSTMLSQLYGSFYNEDKKALTFSDSVQDAAHRAGFFGARTYRFNFRIALQQCIHGLQQDTPLCALPEAFAARWSGLTEEEYIAGFIAPDMEWLREYDQLIQTGLLPPDSDLRELVERRLSWEIFGEFGYRAEIGRTLVRSGNAVIYPDTAKLDKAVADGLAVVSQELELLRGLSGQCWRQFLLGLLMYMRRQGAIYHPHMEMYLGALGETFQFNKQLWTPKFSPKQRRPRFPAMGKVGRFEPLIRQAVTRGSSSSWYEWWVQRCFEADGGDLWMKAMTKDLLQRTMGFLCDAGLLGEQQRERTNLWGLCSDALLVTTKTAPLRCDQCAHHLTIAESEKGYWEGMPCQNRHCKGRYHLSAQAQAYYHNLYERSDVKRIVAREHTGLLDRETREQVESSFMRQTYPWHPNLLSATPTLEMGIDIGSLSFVALCSVPPSQSNYLQRIGRAGRRDGNAMNLVIASARAHDLYFFEEPLEMMAGAVRTPGVFLRATAVLERQLTAFCVQRWINQGEKARDFPRKLGTLLDTIERWQKEKESKSPDEARAVMQSEFPFNLFSYIEGHVDGLLDGFEALFHGKLEPEDVVFLRGFLTGHEGQEASLAFKITDGLHYKIKERQGLRADRRKLQASIKELKKRPKDQNFKRDLDDLEIELKSVSRLQTGLQEKDIFNFLTDEGLLPNYAFPEAGVTLKSFVYRAKDKKGDNESSGAEKKGGQEFESWTYEYQRASALALSELAPSSFFYAGGRKVEVDQINMQVSDVELWRLCDSCDYTERIGPSTMKGACPRCNSSRWSDIGQKRRMLRMRQVQATTSDRESRIKDDSDDRVPAFFNRRMLFDYESQDLRDAFLIDHEELPFGFEFIDKAHFREINLGEKGDASSKVKVSGEMYAENGFVVCGSCGKLQKQGDDEKPNHTKICKHKDDSALDTCVFLYREFTSEAIRILLPVSTLAHSPRGLHSFIAALHLGLERKFRGAVFHLETTLQEEPVPEAVYRKQYLILYDKVPGGTGYLKQLMRDPEPLLEVMEEALAVLRRCSCHQDDGKDGCYRCIFAYRTQYHMDEISRDTAIEMLSELLAHKGKLKPVRQGLRPVLIHSLIDSELEAQFIAALRAHRQPDVKCEVKKSIIQGRPAHLLVFERAGQKRSYTIESQVELGPANGIAVPSRADFVIRPTRNAGQSKPIVVFTDGFTYHRDRVHIDMAQRMALVQSGRYLVWSLTWHDVDSQLKIQAQKHYDDYLTMLARPAHKAKTHTYIEHFNLERVRGLPNEDSFAWLMRYLLAPESLQWRTFAWVRAMMWVDPQTRWPTAEQQPGTVDMLALRGHCEEPRLESAGDHKKTPYVSLAVSIPMAETQSSQPQRCLMLASLDDLHGELSSDLFKRSWNSFLRLYNIAQFLPGALFVTRRGLQEGRYHSIPLERAAEALRRAASPGDPPATAPDGAPLDETEHEAWEELLEVFEEEPLFAVLKGCQEAGWPAPECSHELVVAGVTVAQAEVAWPTLGLALLSQEEQGQAQPYQDAGWEVAIVEQIVDSLAVFLEEHSEQER